MHSISPRWLRRVRSASNRSNGRIDSNRKRFRSLFLENLEPRQLMTSTPWLLSYPSESNPPLTTGLMLPPLGFINTQEPQNNFAIPSANANSPWISPRSNSFFGPREKVWVSDFAPTAESGTAGYIRIERSNPFPTMEVAFRILEGSTAQTDIDYVSPNPIVIFEPGETYIDVPIVAIDDSLTEPTESIQFILWDCSRIGTWIPSDVTYVQISDNDFNNKSSSVELLEPVDAYEGFQDGRLRARRTGSLQDPLTVPFQITLQNELVRDLDFKIDPKDWSYEASLGQFVFPSGEALASISVSSIDDTIAENTEWMDIQLLPSSDGSYHIDGRLTQTLRFIDDENRASIPPGSLPSISSVYLINDTGDSTNDRITSDERIGVTIDGDLAAGKLLTEFDWDNDFIPDTSFTIDQTPRIIEFDPSSIDSNLNNSYQLRTLRYRSIWINQNGISICESPWNSFEYQVFKDPSTGPLQLSGLRLSLDTSIATDRITSNPSVTISIQGEYPISPAGKPPAIIQWDHNQDGIEVVSQPLHPGQRTANYDPRLTDPNYSRFPGSKKLRARLVDPATSTSLSPWETIEFNLVNTSECPWITTGISRSLSESNPLEWILRGQVYDQTSTRNLFKDNSLESVASKLTVQIDTDRDGHPDTTTTVANDFTFEYSLISLPPGEHLLRLRVQQWSIEDNAFINGSWIDYLLDIPNPEPIPVPTPRLRLDDGLSDSDRVTSDPTILIDIGMLPNKDHSDILEIDLDSDLGNPDLADLSIPVGINQDGSANLASFHDESITTGLKHYRFRTRSFNRISGVETSSDWVDFFWTFAELNPPVVSMKLLCDDGASSDDRKTSIPTVIGEILSFSQYRNTDSMQIEIDLNSDGKVDRSIAPLRDGSFTIRPNNFSFDNPNPTRQHVSARILWVDPVRNIPLHGQWASLDYEWIPPAPIASCKITGLRLLVDTGRSSTDRVSSVSTIVGSVETAQHCLGVQIDKNKDGIPDDQVDVGSEGRFQYSPMGLEPSNHLFQFRSIHKSSSPSNPAFSDWQPFDFTYVQSTVEPLIIDLVELVNDSGKPGDHRTEQGRIAGHVSSLSGISNAIVLVDLNLDGQADESVGLDTEGRFIFDSKTSLGQVNVSFQAMRIGPSSVSQADSDHWTHFSFLLEDQPDSPPELSGVTFTQNPLTGHGSITGGIRSQKKTEGITIGFDTDQDGLADYLTKTNAFGNFSFNTDDFPAGNYTFNVRALTSENSLVACRSGDWESISFKIQNSELSPAKIESLRLRLDDGIFNNDRVTSDASVQGKVDRNASVGLLIIEFDTNGDSIVDASVIPNPDLSFQMSPQDLENGPFRIRARTKELLSSGDLLRSDWREFQGTLIAESKSSLAIRSIELVNDQGPNANDHRSDSPKIAGSISRDTNIKETLWVDIDLDQDGLSDQSEIISGSFFNVSPSINQSGMVSLALRLRDVTTDQSSIWYPFEFLYHPEPRGLEADSLVRCYKSVANAINQGKSDHVQGLSRAFASLLVDQQATQKRDQDASEDSFATRLNALREISVGYWEETIQASEQFRDSQSQAILKLRQTLSIDNSDAMLWLPEELQLLWPTMNLPNLPRLVADWLPAEETLPTPPLQSPAPWEQPQVPNVTWSRSLLEALDGDPLSQFGTDINGDLEAQSALQQIRSDLLSERRFVEEIANMAYQRARLLRDSTLSAAESQYRQSLTKSRLNSTDLRPEDYSEIYKEFTEERNRVQQEYQTRRKELESKYHQAFRFLSESHASQKQTCLRNRDSILDTENRLLSRTLNTIPPPTWKTVEPALQRHSRKTFEAHLQYDKAIAAIVAEEQAESFKLQKDQLTESHALETCYADLFSKIDFELEIAIAENKKTGSLHRAVIATDHEKAKEIAMHQLETARLQSWSDWQRTGIQIEHQRRIGMDTALRQYDLSVASMLSLALHRIDSVKLNSASKADVQRALERKQLLFSWENSAHQESNARADLWKQLKTENLNSETIKNLGELNSNHENRLRRITATDQFRRDHATLAYQHTIELAQTRRESITEARFVELNWKKETQLNGIEYLEAESVNSNLSLYRKLDALVYTPSKPAGWTEGWGWIDGTFLGALVGSASIPTGTANEISKDDSIASAEALFRHELKTIETDRSFFIERDRIEETFANDTESLVASSLLKEQGLLKSFHLEMAIADRDLAINQIDISWQYEFDSANASKENQIALNSLELQAQQGRADSWIEYQKSIRRIEFETKVLQWDSYLAATQSWRDSNPSPWTDYVINQAISSRNLNIQSAQIANDLTDEQSLYDNAASFLSLEIEIKSDSALAEFQCENKIDIATASRELGRSIANANYHFAERTAGTSHGTSTGLNLVFKARRHPNLLPFKTTLAEDTAAVDLKIAQSRREANLVKAEAVFDHAVALERLWSDLGHGVLNWDQYSERFGMLQRVLSDKLDASESNLSQTRLNLDSQLREQRSESVRSISIEMENIKIHEAQWAKLEDTPESIQHQGMLADLDTEIRTAKDQFAQTKAQLIFAEEAAIAESTLNRSTNLSKTNDQSDRSNQAIAQRHSLRENETKETYTAISTQLRNDYQRRATEILMQQVEKNHRKLDPKTRSFYQQQLLAAKSLQASIRDAQTQKEYDASNLRRNEFAESMVRNSSYNNSLLQIQQELSNGILATQKTTRVSQAEFNTVWMTNAQQSKNHFDHSERIAENRYDQRSSETLLRLNSGLHESQSIRAVQTGDAWKQYYLSIHPDSESMHPAVRKQIDHWLGLTTSKDLQAGAFWRSQPLESRDWAGFTNQTPSGRLAEQLQQIHDNFIARSTEEFINFTAAMGDAKSDRIEDLSKAQIDLIQQQNLNDSSLSENMYQQSLKDQTLLRELESQTQEKSDQIENSFSLEQHQHSLRNRLLADKSELDFLDRTLQASNDYERSLARAQAQFVSIDAKRSADDFAKTADRDIRSQTLSTHLVAYGAWIDEVSSSYVDWVSELEQAKRIHTLELLSNDQQYSLSKHKAQTDCSLKTETLRRNMEREKDAISFGNETELAKTEHQATLQQMKTDLIYRLGIMSHQADFLKASEHANAISRESALRGSGLLDQQNKANALIADAKRLKDKADQDALLDWRNQTVSRSLQHDSIVFVINQAHQFDLERIDSRQETSIYQLETDRDDSISTARRDHQINSMESSSRLAQSRLIAQSAWLSDAAKARIVARGELQKAFPGPWSDFLVGLAEKELDDLNLWNSAEDQLVRLKAQVDSEYTSSIAEAQLIESLDVHHARLDELEKRIRQGLISLESGNQIALNQKSRLNTDAAKYVQSIIKIDHEYALQSIELGQSLLKDPNSQAYRERLELLTKKYQSDTASAIQALNSGLATIHADQRTADSNRRHQDQLASIQRESQLATQLRNSHLELIERESAAYRISEEAWANYENDYAIATAELQIDMAEEIDQQLQNPWSAFYLDISLAKAKYNASFAEATKEKVQSQTRRQSEHEIQQARLESKRDEALWLSNDNARSSIAELDWRLDLLKINAIRLFAPWTNPSPWDVLTPKPIFSPELRSIDTDDRYNLVFTKESQDLSNDPFAWHDQGFLAWIRSPQEQFQTSYWAIQSGVEKLNLAWQTSSTPPTLIPQVLQDNPHGLLSRMTEVIQTPTHQLALALGTQVASIQLDQQTPTEISQWYDLYGRHLNAAQRPDTNAIDSIIDGLSESHQTPKPLPTLQTESIKRVFVHNQDQWNRFLQFADGNYGSLYEIDTTDVISDWLNKFQNHVGVELDDTKSKLLMKSHHSNEVQYPDRVVEEGGVVFWRHAIGIEPNRIEGNPISHFTQTPIGTLDSQGWVKLSSGHRVLYSAIRKWSDELILGTSEQINSLIDGLISPFQIDSDSKEYGIFIGGTGMHMFGLGNVERLYNAYQGTKFYYGGVGNPVEYDSMWNGYTDNAIGNGWQKILDRIEADVISHYRGHQKLHVFGWSRGAAMAIEFAKRMERYQIDVDFLGLFDPVYSYLLPGQSSSLIQWTDSGRIGNYVSKKVSTNVKSVGAIYAANEDRSFFPATKLNADIHTRLSMLKSPGTHGEIGGHFQSNLKLQQLNLTAMMELATKEGQASFHFHGVEPDLARIYASPLTQKLQLAGSYNEVERMDVRQQVLDALKLEQWQALDAEQYYQSLVDCSLQQWRVGGFGFQKDNFSGLLLFSLETAKELVPHVIYPNPLNPWADGQIHQSPWTHYRRNLNWCKLELWDLDFLRDQEGNQRLSERQKRAVREFYNLVVDPKTGDWRSSKQAMKP